MDTLTPIHSTAAVVAVAALTSVALLVLVFVKPSVTLRRKAHGGTPAREISVSIYWIAPLIGALALVAGGALSPAETLAGLTAATAVNPLKILVLFLAMTLMSVFLDGAGFFRYLALTVLRRAGGSQRRVFVYLYLTVSVLTLFTSNDIVVLTFTPFICYFARAAGIRPLPYLIGEFVAANTWSMALLIGNPTNIYLAAGAGIGFADYLAVMAIPTLLAGAVALAVLWLLFRRPLAAPMTAADDAGSPTLADRPAAILGGVHLGGCLVAMVASSVWDIPLWKIAAVACASLLVCATVYSLLTRRGLSLVSATLARAPWEIVPFVLSMFVVVLALQKVGVTDAIAAALDGHPPLLCYGGLSFLAANVVNNIPMSVLFSSVLAHGGGAAHTAALYATVVGSNVGAFFTPVGALAGIMWMSLLKRHGVRLSFGRFVLYGAAVALPALAAALAGLWLVL